MKNRKASKTHTKARPHVTSISIARLYNLGHYEPLHYELAVQIPDGTSAAETMLEMVAILARLKPVAKPFNYDHAVEVLNKLPEQTSEQEKEWLEDYRQLVEGYNGIRALRREAIRKLDELGGSSKHADAKENWTDEEAPW